MFNLKRLWHSERSLILDKVLCYLAKGLNSVLTSKDESVTRLWFLRASSASKHCLSSLTTSLMFGLFLGSGDTQAIPISRAFHAELVSKSPCNAGSTILVIEPLAIIELTHWLM